jgi:hypothetical protein
MGFLLHDCLAVLTMAVSSLAGNDGITRPLRPHASPQPPWAGRPRAWRTLWLRKVDQPPTSSGWPEQARHTWA